ncbi:peptidyl-prolyl cis-trans isomerase CYP21-4-like isoform X2 [Aristolochia californica]|uniref:peptidyl-prolyl cis-trans isomerase CYP21-4-like isoform X2 n=1 Tax=Aristolochia californica TaxID=171875 RepID=UPI0035E06DB4
MARIKPQALLIQSKKKKGPTRISISTIVTCNLIVVLIVLSLVATYRHWSLRSRTELEDGSQNIEDAEARELKFELPSYAVLNTSKGLITVELHKESSPEIVDRFLDLCNKGYFKGMLFHRVVKNFVIEGGEPQGVGTAEDWTSRGKTQSQLATSPKHEAFMLGTSKMKQDNSGFQLFVTTAPIPDLNDKLIVFGRVIKGEDIVQTGKMDPLSSSNCHTHGN